MDDYMLEQAKSQARSRDQWHIAQLSEFFGISKPTVRRRLKDGEITGKKRDTESGSEWSVTGDELARCIDQSEKLQNYFEKTIEDERQGEIRRPGEDMTQMLQDLIQENRHLQEKLGDAREEKARVETENEHLKAKLDELTDPLALPSGKAKSTLETLNWIPVVRRLIPQDLRDKLGE